MISERDLPSPIVAARKALREAIEQRLASIKNPPRIDTQRINEVLLPLMQRNSDFTRYNAGLLADALVMWELNETSRAWPQTSYPTEKFSEKVDQVLRNANGAVIASLAERHDLRLGTQEGGIYILDVTRYIGIVFWTLTMQSREPQMLGPMYWKRFKPDT
jgi:hypothetical protein